MSPCFYKYFVFSYGQPLERLFSSLNHTIVILESDDRCEMLGTGCGYNGRLPGRRSGSVEFVKLDVEVRQPYLQLFSKTCEKTLNFNSCFPSFLPLLAPASLGRAYIQWYLNHTGRWIVTFTLVQLDNSSRCC